jgi:hypothetical protein
VAGVGLEGLDEQIHGPGLSKAGLEPHVGVGHRLGETTELCASSLDELVVIDPLPLEDVQVRPVGEQVFMVRPLGFEPRTCGLRVRCSAIELEARGMGRIPDRRRSPSRL